MFCRKCGSQLADDAAFCHKCGTPPVKIEELSVSTPVLIAKIEDTAKYDIVLTDITNSIELSEKAHMAVAYVLFEDEIKRVSVGSEPDPNMKRHVQDEATRKAYEMARNLPTTLKRSVRKKEALFFKERLAGYGVTVLLGYCPNCGGTLGNMSDSCTVCGQVAIELGDNVTIESTVSIEKPMLGETSSFCKKCGTLSQGEAKFCRKCGSPTGDPPAFAASVPMTSAQTSATQVQRKKLQQNHGVLDNNEIYDYDSEQQESKSAIKKLLSNKETPIPVKVLVVVGIIAGVILGIIIVFNIINSIILSIWDESVSWLIWIVLIVVGGIYLARFFHTKITRESNQKFVEQVSSKDFNAERTIEVGESLLLIDNTKKKWCAKEHNNSVPRIYSFKDLNEFEIYEDGDSIVKGRAGSALMGGLLFGSTGAIIGSARRKTVSNICRILQLRIQVNDFHNPEIIMTIINSEVNKNSAAYRNCINLAKQIASTLSFIQNDGKNIEPTSSSTVKQPDSGDSVADSVRVLAKLKDEGLLSEEEFNKKKEDLLSRM